VIAIERRLVGRRLPSYAEFEGFFAPRTTQPPGLHWLDDTPLWPWSSGAQAGAG
jgi:hypothetical protein